MKSIATTTVFHVLPSLAVGGIETMVVRFMNECPPDIDYRLLVLSTEETTEIALSAMIQKNIQYFGSRKSLLTYLRAALALINSSNSIIVSSTWRAALVVWLANRFSNTNRHIAFTHRSSEAHPIDRILRRWQVRHSLLNIADSQSSAEWVNAATSRRDATVLDPIFSPPALYSPKTQDLTICFIGRLAPVKNLETVFKLVEKLAAEGLALTFHIYGPNAGRKNLVDQWITKYHKKLVHTNLNLAYLGALPPQEVHQVVARYHFIVSCSHTEGFAMSIAEAMQVGTIPIVGKIGGPATYCRQENAILLDDYSDPSIENVVRQVQQIWSSPSRYRAMSDAAKRTFIANHFFPQRYTTLLKQLKKRPFQPWKQA